LGQNDPTLSTLEKLAKALKIDVTRPLKWKRPARAGTRRGCGRSSRSEEEDVMPDEHNI